jgi:uncharacterized protein YjbK
MGDDEEFIRIEIRVVRNRLGEQTPYFIDDEKDQQQDKQCFESLLQHFQIIFNPQISQITRIALITLREMRNL